jgi:hypothetical protein
MAGHTPTKWVTSILVICALMVCFLTFTDSFLIENDVTYMNRTWANLSQTVEDIASPDSAVVNSIYENANGSLTSWEDAETVSYGALSYWDKMIKSLGIAFRTLTGIGDIASSIATPAGEATGLSDSGAGQALIWILMTCLAISIIFMILRAMTGRDL